MTMEMIEKVARALFIARSWQTGTVGDWDDITELERETARQLAQAAITAYNPNERLREALELVRGKAKLAADALGNSSPVFDSVREGFRIIERECDAALSHKEGSNVRS